MVFFWIVAPVTFLLRLLHLLLLLEPELAIQRLNVAMKAFPERAALPKKEHIWSAALRQLPSWPRMRFAP